MVNISEISQTIRKLVETRINLIKEEIQDQVMGVVTRVLLLVIIGGLMLLVLLFFSLALAFFLSSVFESTYSGFLLVGLFYLLLVVGLYWLRYSPSIRKEIQGGMSNFIFDNSKKEEDGEEGA
ncbi:MULTISPECIES: phage holin family protein [Algoriphagus]|uniref:Phage holin family protein n=2 Tax=Algoriphagus TaxID=246875 RepID=A0A4Y9QWC2_9BACT|nr:MULTISPECIES: phage holin family protein [Algoriphagus]MCS5490805.1 phage holin family protein [Algoriphagus limi]TFV95892.1 phage holin family protein [Algoriphagus kandeliae]